MGNLWRGCVCYVVVYVILMTQETFTFKIIIVIIIIITIIMPQGTWKTVHFYYNLCDSIIRQLQLRIKLFNQFLGIYK